MAVAEVKAPKAQDVVDEKPKRTRAKKGEGTPAPMRPYRIGVDVEGTLDEIMDKLREMVPEGEKAKIFLHVGNSTASTPRAAITYLAEHKNLNGDYDVVADAAFTHYPNVRVEQKPRVSIG